MKTKYSLIALLTTFSANLLNAQENGPIQDVATLKQHKEVLKQQYPNDYDELIIKDVSRLNDKHSRISYTQDGVYKESIVNSGREGMLLVATFQEINFRRLPKIVKTNLKKSEHQDWDVARVYKVRTPYSDWFYALDVRKEEIIKRLYYSDLGEYLEHPY